MEGAGMLSEIIYFCHLICITPCFQSGTHMFDAIGKARDAEEAHSRFDNIDNSLSWVLVAVAHQNLTILVNGFAFLVISGSCCSHQTITKERTSTNIS